MAKFKLSGAARPEQGAAQQAPAMTLSQAIERFIQAKSRKKSLAFDRLHLRHFAKVFGPDTPLTEITAAKISAWQDKQLASVCPRTGRLYTPGAVNRPL